MGCVQYLTRDYTAEWVIGFIPISVGWELTVYKDDERAVLVNSKMRSSLLALVQGQVVRCVRAAIAKLDRSM